MTLSDSKHSPHSEGPHTIVQPLVASEKDEVPGRGFRSLQRSPSTEHTPKGREWASWILGLVLALAIFLVYSNSFNGPFQYDDFNDVLDNPSIRHLWPLKDVFFIPGNGFVTRPVANLTFAINFATGGLKPLHYHITNLTIHICASLAFLGVLRRTLSLPTLKERFSGQTSTLSIIVAVCWSLHPLLTESVAYITQRYESLMGLFVFLTFYCLLRTVDSPSSLKWGALASLSCLLALGSKEVAVSVPILVLLFDRTFMAGSFRRAWQERRSLYIGLALAWIGFVYMQLHSGQRSFAGFGLAMPWWRYALNQPAVILHYLRLAVWPHPLNFDYFWPVAKKWYELLPGFMVIGSLLILTVWAMIRKPKVAFLSIFFFLILAPTSSVMPILDLAVEHRMYLPLAPVVVCIVLMIRYVFGPNRVDQFIKPQVKRIIALIVVASSISALAAMTYLRNEDYQDPIDLWRDAVAKSPNNPRAHHNYAFFLSQGGYIDEAYRQYNIAITQAPGTAIFQSNYGVFLGKIGQFSESIKHLRIAVQLEPNDYKHYVNLGGTFFARGSYDNSVICYEEATQINPKAAIPYSALATVMWVKNETSKAQVLIKKAISIEPHNSEFRFKLGLILLTCRDLPGAHSAFQAAIHLDANPETMASIVGWAYHDSGMDQDAVSNLHQALSFKPSHERSLIRLAWILATSKNDSVRNGNEALLLSEHLLKSQSAPTPELLDLRAVSLAEAGRFQEAQTEIRAALAKSKDRKEPWIPQMEERLVLFENRTPYRETPKGLLPAKPMGYNS